jgi:hypothetical protein
MKFDYIQLLLLICGASSIVLLSEPNLLIFGYLVVLFSQPIWMYETWKKRQWGIFILAFVYTASALNGINNLYGFIDWKRYVIM